MSSYFEPDAGGQKISSGTTSVSVVRPDLAIGALITAGGVAFTYGAFVTIAAAADLAAHMLIGFFVDYTNTAGGSGLQFQIATGNAGAEVVIGTVFTMTPVIAGTPHYVPIIPFLQIPANARVSVRCASNNAAAQSNVTLTFIPRPLA